MVDFGKINPEVIKALKDGRINEQEAKKLGLDEKVVKELNEAFAAGAAEVGDFVVVNKGKTTKNGKTMQLSQVKKNSNAQKDEPFFKFTDAKGEFSWLETAKTVGKTALVAVTLPFAILQSCDKGDHEQIVNNNNENVNKITAQVTAEVKVELGNLEAYVKELIAKFDDPNGVLQQILNNIKQFKNDTSVKLDDVINLQKQTINAVIQGNTILTNIYDKIGKNHDDDVAYQKQVLELLSDLKLLIQNSAAEGSKFANAILAAIKNIPGGGSVDLSGIENLLKQLLDGQKENKAQLEKLADILNRLDANVCAGMAEILAAIKNQPDYSKRLDTIIDKLEALGSTAQDILQAIKDHKVDVTVDVTGKVTCECNCNCGQPHEGIIGDLEDLLN